MSLPNSFRQLLGLQPSTVTPSADGKSTLLVIDAQQTYDNGSPLAIDQIETRQKVISKVVEQYRSANAPIVWVQHSAGNGAPVFNPENATFDFIGDLRPNQSSKNEEIIVKGAPSSFTGTNLKDILDRNGSKQLVLTGYMAHVCVTGTARSAMENGYDVVVVKDAIGDRHIPSHDGKRKVEADTIIETVCDELGDAIATIVTSNDIKA